MKLQPNNIDISEEERLQKKGYLEYDSLSKKLIEVGYTKLSEIEKSHYEKILKETLGKQEIMDSDFFEEMKKVKIKHLQLQCNKVIIEGFNSESTGYLFEFDTHDQINFNQQLTFLSNNTNITTVRWKTNSGIVEFNRDQFMIICDEAEKHKRTQIEKYWDLKDKVEKATKESEIISIVW